MCSTCSHVSTTRGRPPSLHALRAPACVCRVAFGPQPRKLALHDGGRSSSRGSPAEAASWGRGGDGAAEEVGEPAASGLGRTRAWPQSRAAPRAPQRLRAGLSDLSSPAGHPVLTLRVGAAPALPSREESSPGGPGCPTVNRTPPLLSAEPRAYRSPVRGRLLCLRVPAGALPGSGR